MMVVFNKHGDQPEHSWLAARATLTLQTTASEIAQANSEWPRFRAGLNSGEVVIGEGTFRLLPDGTRVEELPALRIKGKSEPVTAYILREVPG